MQTIYFRGSAVAFALLLTAVTLPCRAQSSTPPKREHISNHLLWTTLVLQGKISSKLSYQFDFEYRRQADPMQSADPNTPVGDSHYNILKHNYQYAVRSWVHYQPSPAAIFSVSPIALFGTWSGASFQPELRPAFQVTLNNNLGRVALMNRYRYELRYFGTREAVEDDEIFGTASAFHFTSSTRQGRFRYMLRGTIPINNKTITKGTYFAVLSGEILLRTGKNVSNNNLLDQVRFYGGLGYKATENLRIELGYMNMTAYRLNNAAKNNVEVNNVIWLRFTVENFNKVFERKTKTTAAVESK